MTPKAPASEAREATPRLEAIPPLRPVRDGDGFVIAPDSEAQSGDVDLTYRQAAHVAVAVKHLTGFVLICEMFTTAAHDARDALNGAGLPCPASIALAAEHARNALAALQDSINTVDAL